MLNNYIPYQKYNNIKEIDYSELKEKGIKALFFDLDNTLIKPNEAFLPKDIITFLKNLEKTFKVIIISNNNKNRINKAINFEFTSCPNAGKPKPNSFFKIMKELNLSPEQVCHIGDQIISDVSGANNAGIYSILINPISLKDDKLFTRFNRFKEKIILHFISKKYPLIYNKLFNNFPSKDKFKVSKTIYKGALLLLKSELKDDKNRFNHSLEVYERAIFLAEKHNFKINSDFLYAALFHDVCKNYTLEKHKELLPEDLFNEFKESPLLHGVSGSIFLLKNNIVKEKEYLDAVKYHTTGIPNMTIGQKIIFLADKTDLTRKDEFVNSLRLIADENLDEALITYLKHIRKKLLEKNKQIAKEQDETYKFYIKE